MGIQINGNNDIISALDGSWTAEGASINTSGILTATTFKGNVTGTACTFVDGNFTGNVTIGGTLTYEDVTNIDSVGLVTARNGIFIPDDKKLEFGNEAGSGDLTIKHFGGGNSYITDTTNDVVIQTGVLRVVNAADNQNLATFSQGGASDLYFAGSQKITTASSGVNVVGTTTTGQLAVTGVSTFTGVANFDNAVTVDGDLSIADKIVHIGDTNTAIRFPAADIISFERGGGEALRITTANAILTNGVTAEPLYPHYVTARKIQAEIKGALDVGQTRHHGSLAVNCTNSNSFIGLVRSDNTQTDGTDIGVIGWTAFDGTDFHQAAAIMVEKGAGAGNDDQPGHMVFKTNSGTTSATEKLRIDSSGRLLIGDDTNSSGSSHKLQVFDAGAAGSIALSRFTASSYSSYIDFYKSRNATLGSKTVVNSGDNLGAIRFYGVDGSNSAYYQATEISSQCDGASNAANDMPGRLTFSTRGDGTSSNLTERLRIDSTGHVSLRNEGNSHQELQWYCGTSKSATIGWGNGSANWEFKHFRADSQAGAPYANIDFFTGSTSSPSRALRITEDGMILIGETNDDGMSSYDLGMKNGRVIRHRNAAGNAWINTFGLDSSNNIKIGWGGSPNEIHFGISGIGETLKILSDGNIRWWPDGSSGVNLHATSATSGIVLAANKDGAVGTTWHFKNQKSSGSAGTWMEVDDSQRVHIPYSYGGTDKLNIYTGSDAASKGITIIGQDGNNQNSDAGVIHFNGYAQTNGPWIQGKNVQSWGKKALVFGTVSTTNDYTTEVSETMRLTQYGNIQFGISPNDTLWDSSNNEQGVYYRRSEGSFAMATRSSTGYSNWYMNKNTTNGTSDTRWIDFYWDQNTKDKIWYNSGSVAFGGYSDHRLKENITEIDDGIAKVKQLKPSYYNWKTGTGRDEFSDIKQSGFIAHELQSVLPNLVDGTKDQVVTQEEFDAGTQPEESTVGTPIYQSVDYQKITPILTAALKEAIAKIEVLEAKVAALEGS